MRTCLWMVAFFFTSELLWPVDAVAADYAGLKSCENEVRAFERQAKTQHGRLTVTEQELEGWVGKHFLVDRNVYNKYWFAWAQLEDADSISSLEKAREAVDFHQQDARKNEAAWGGRPPCKGWYGCNDNPEFHLTQMRRSQLMACVARIRFEELSRAGNAGSLRVPAALTPAACPQEQIARLNASLSAIDEAVGRFMQGPDGQSSAVTPSLKTLMWATREQNVAIRKSPCASEPAFASRLSANDRVHQQALANCLALNQQAVCTPADPGVPVAAPAAAGVSGTGAAKPAGKASQSGDCAGSGSIAGFLACQKAECRKAGFSPVEVNGCVTCGDEEGSYAGLQWRKCHRNSSGVSVGR